MANITITNYTIDDGIRPDKTEQHVIAGAATDTFIRGTLMGRITASAKWQVYDSGAGDGTEVVKGILLNEVDTTNGVDSPCGIMLTGEIDEHICMIDGGTQGENITKALKDAMRDYGINVMSKTECGVIDNPQS